MTKKGKNLLIWRRHVTMAKKDEYIKNELQLQNHPLSFLRKKTLLSATSILPSLPMAYNTTASLNKVTFTGYVDFG